MIGTTTDKLIATVLQINDLDALFPSVFKGRIGLDVRVDRGSLLVGKKVRLHGRNSEDDVEIVGIEMLYNVANPELIRIVCTKPGMLTLPTEKAEGWTLTELE